MNKTDLALALKGKPVPYTTPGGVKIDLRPMTVPERLALFAWFNERKEASGTGWSLKARYVSLGLCNGDGEALFTEEEVVALPMSAAEYDAIADEVARRAGLGKDDEGKALPATPS